MTQYQATIDGSAVHGTLTWNANWTLQNLTTTDPFNSSNSAVPVNDGSAVLTPDSTAAVSYTHLKPVASGSHPDPGRQFLGECGDWPVRCVLKYATKRPTAVCDSESPYSRLSRSSALS